MSGDPIASQNGVFYLLSDHLGSSSVTVKATDEVLTKVAELRYKPWGENRYSGYSETATPTDRRFTGQRLEQELGIYHYGARWYDPMTGRFLSPDTIVPDPGNPIDLDRYAYARNNPLRYTDPTGHRVDDGCNTEGCSATQGEEYRDYVYNIIHNNNERQQNTKKVETAEKIAETGVSILWEPADWAITTTNCLNGDCSPLAFLGILPLIPSSIGKYSDEVVGLLPKPVRSNYPFHHLLPQRFRKEFARLGIDVDDYLVSLPRQIHELIHGGGSRGGMWNSGWEEWLSNNPGAIAQDVFQQIGVFIHDFGLDGIIKIVK